MPIDLQIPEPLLFNPIKHYLPFIKKFINEKTEEESYPGSKNFLKALRHLGTCVMDIYTGGLPLDSIFSEIQDFLGSNGISGREEYKKWAGTSFSSCRIISLSDSSQWTLKHNNNEARYVHIFPARSGRNTFRIKANTLKSAILYQVLIGKDYISGDDLNRTRALIGLSPVKEIADAEAITELIEILRR